MRADYRVVLDACVLIPMPLADTLLRMAEAPRLFLPRWSQVIMDEVTRNLIAKWDMAAERAHDLIVTYNRRHFPAASVDRSRSTFKRRPPSCAGSTISTLACSSASCMSRQPRSDSHCRDSSIASPRSFRGL